MKDGGIKMKIGIANDHRAYELKEKLKKMLDVEEIIDYGCFSNERDINEHLKKSFKKIQ